ncbi:DUF4126 domain-containing protein [Tamlana fucoidanivorans]|uniref:DUF4126 domain-containing protein n=1 Tax=Allotamlana fucoidanivorans TaxID=2583814 RepID=A0A5C4SFH8_9FLAO|nr:DUF4126 domain-containing protein [Tamlana fucoidanivorans]TNJ41712.1 DUF4126 domain-containing protein [Tamlana fucoidanivorans]
MTVETIMSICLGIGLAASVGFRVFLPLFALSLVAYFDVWHLNESWEWLGSTAALITLGVATIVEIIAYFIPYIDNLLDTIAVPLATLGGTLVMLSTVSELSPLVTWALAIIAGGGTAAAISGASSSARFTSTVSTAGFGNPLVSIFETGCSIIMALISIFLPLLGGVFVLLLLIFIYKFFRKFKSSTP